jgi:hypothetical protein
VDQDLALARGGELDGKLGRCQPGPDKLDKLLAMGWTLLGMRRRHWRHLAAYGGQLCFAMQFRRSAFCVLDVFWSALYSGASDDLWFDVSDEILASMLVLPLVYMDFKAPVSDLVTCSDASEQGAGVCVARSLSDGGREALVRALSPLANLLHGAVGLWESFAGIGGAREALFILGIQPVFYVAVEKSERAAKVLSAAWPGITLMTDVRAVDQKAVDEVAARSPSVRVVLHAAGSPCPGLCAWNPFRSKSADEGVELFQEVRRITKLLEVAFPKVAVEELEENVSSMSISPARCSRLSMDTLLWNCR